MAALLSSSSISHPSGIVGIRSRPEGKAITRIRTICMMGRPDTIPTMQVLTTGTGALKKVVDHLSSHVLIKGTRTTGVIRDSPQLTGVTDGATLRLVTLHLAQDLRLVVVTGAHPTLSHLAPKDFSLDRKC